LRYTAGETMAVSWRGSTKSARQRSGGPFSDSGVTADSFFAGLLVESSQQANESTTTAESLRAYWGGLIAIMSSQLATMASQIAESEKRKASRDVISAPSALDCHRKEACHLRQAPSPGRTYPPLQSTRFIPELCVPLATRRFSCAGRLLCMTLPSSLAHISLPRCLGALSEQERIHSHHGVRKRPSGCSS